MAARRVYDRRIRALVSDPTCDPGLLHVLRLPRSTVASWRTRGMPQVVTLPDADSGLPALREENRRLQARLVRTERCLAIALAVARLLTVLVKLAQARLDGDRLPDGDAKAVVLGAISRAAASLPLDAALRTVGLSESRYHAWQRAEKLCLLDDRQSCPKSHPTQLTPEEVASMKELVHDPELRHMPLGTLALFAQRIKKVFAHPQTWSRISRARGWLRPRIRLYPDKPKVGVRATAPNQFWHIDVTIVKLLDGSRVYLRAVIDNYSRRILAWHADAKLSPEGTCAILLQAAKNLIPGATPPSLICDSGVENLNGSVDELLKTGVLKRILAQVDVPFSNSLIESWWRSLKYQWLFVNPLTSLDVFKTLVAFFVQQHNQVMPHSAFRGQTPDEMYFGTGASVPTDLAAARLAARTARIARNQELHCSTCGPPAEVLALPAPSTRIPEDSSIAALASG